MKRFYLKVFLSIKGRQCDHRVRIAMMKYGSGYSKGVVRSLFKKGIEWLFLMVDEGGEKRRHSLTFKEAEVSECQQSWLMSQ